MPNPDHTYRVLALPRNLLAAMRAARDAAETTNAKFIAAAVDTYLSQIAETLKKLGFGAFTGESQTARLPFDDEAGTLGALKDAAETVGLPASTLLQLCVTFAVRQEASQTRRRGRPPKSEKSADEVSAQTENKQRGRRIA